MTAATPAIHRLLRLPALLLGMAGLLLPGSAAAQSCTTTASPTISFGSIDVLSGSNIPTSSSITVQCNLGLLSIGSANFKVCLSIGGASGTTPRTMASGANNLNYNLYTDSAHTQIWGSVFSGSPTGVVDIPLSVSSLLLGGTASTSVPIYGYLQASQNTTAPAGSYTQNLTGGQVVLTYNYTYSLGTPGTPASCASGSGTSVSGTFGFSPTATVINSCQVSTSNINFGSASSLGGVLHANGSVSVTCTMSDNYTITLGTGSTSGATLTDRRMQGPGSNVAHYELYTSSAYSTIWGDGVSGGTGNVTGVGNATQQTHTVYGQVQAQTTPALGSYSDAVIVTVNY